MLRFALFGAGRIGLMHAKNLAAHPQTELACVYDIHGPAAAEVAELSGACVAADVETALNDSSVDAVLIASSTNTHVDLITQAAQTGKAILCEKPIDLDLARVNQCRQEIAQYAVPIQIGFNRRFDPGHRGVREAVKNGEVGRLEKLIITSRDPGEPPIEYLKVSGGLFRDMMIHDFDLARFIMNEDPMELTALGHAPTGSAAASTGDLHTAMVLMKTASGTLCHINCSRRANYGYDQRVEAFGPGGMVISNNRTANNLERYNKHSTAACEPILHFFIERYAESYVAEIESFVNAVENEHEPTPSFADGRSALILAEAAEESLRSDRTVHVTY